MLCRMYQGSIIPDVN